MRLSFIIVNYQSEKCLAKCISSVKEKVAGVEYEIIVVNNDRYDILEAEPPKKTKLINSGENIGFGAACNLGAKDAQGEIFCFLNPDAEIISENIQAILDEFDKYDGLAILGPKLLSDKNETQWWCAGKEFTLWRLIKNNLGMIESRKIWESNIPVECAWISGAAMFMRKDIFQKLGGFDEKFFMYFEDIDLCRRARQLGHKVLYFPDFVIKHVGGKSFLDKKEQKRYYRKSQISYFRKHLLNYKKQGGKIESKN